MYGLRRGSVIHHTAIIMVDPHDDFYVATVVNRGKKLFIIRQTLTIAMIYQ
ncbi:hypothetical protein [Virgibacillus profundi]|uniref:hypothetical protein n=1 Tax=Virgibacillus profundi TaxID=2024555 RepID=UPI0013FD6617|nr:hypothetical protein [Virgibacillus profundi]